MKIFNALILTLAILAQPLAASAEPLTVAVAANVKYAFDELAAEFTKQTGVDVRSVVSSSGKLTAQIKSGAPYDVFLSADMSYPAILYQDGQATSPPKVYANGALVLWTMSDADLSKGVAGLTDSSFKKVAIASPKLAPYGREAIKALDFYKVRAAVEPKLVYGESISQVNQYIDSKSVDVGFTAKSVVLSPELQGKGKWVEVPNESYEPIAQGLVILRHGSENNGDAARKFYGFVFSSKAQAIFTKYGYKLP
ncbi:molybdate-binding periplasmic protein precursor [mine drainage metagenome]|uniref:Molybdate-binding periplasmic protein n=1 Tax=mine drainage metagenome TaxID=410659 RepID=A0A1J5TVQ3_9ZZZZ